MPRAHHINKTTFTQHILVMCCVIACAVGAAAQVPDVEIYWNPADKRDTIIDFDVTLEGFAVYRTFTVNNRSSFAVALPERLAPYFVIVNTPDVEPQDPRSTEFGADDPFPFVIPPNTARSFRLIFQAYKDNGLFPPDIPTEALLQLKVVAASNPSGPGVFKVFRLRALKTTRPLASNTRNLSFDSVYVFPNPVPSLRYRIRNVTPADIRIDKQITRPHTPIVTQPPELRIDTFPQVLITGRDSVEYLALYAPVDQGLDSISFLVQYRAHETAPTDTVQVEVSGIGVEQRLNTISAIGSPNPIASRDTTRGIVVNFGDVPVNGTTYTATIVVTNAGNLNLGYDSEMQIGAPRDTSAFRMTRPWSAGGTGLSRGSEDTLVVAFTPTTSGDHNSTFVLTTDITRRNIKGVPDGANLYTVYLRGFGQLPQLQAPSELDFGSIVHLPGCASNSQQILRIANVGNATLVVDSITITKGTGNVIVNSPATFSIPIGGSEDIRVDYEAALVGPDNGMISLWTNAVTSRVDVAYRAIVVPRDSITVQLPDRITSRPGSLVSIPIIIDGAGASLTNLASFTLTFDPSLLRYNSMVTLGTASTGATPIVESEFPRGVLKITLDKNGNFQNNDTLVMLRFDTYLGNKVEAELSLSNATTTFGNDGCASVLDVRTTSGVFALDSICGLSYKTSGPPGSIRTAVFPNPTSDAVRIAVVVRDTTTVDITLRDALGRTVAQQQTGTLLPSSSHLISLDVTDCRPGTYFIEVRSAFYFATIPLVVSK